MFDFIPLDLTESEALAMDGLFLTNASIKKRAEILNDPPSVLPDQISYLVIIIMTDYLDKDPQDLSSVDRLLNQLQVEKLSSIVLVPLVLTLKRIQHLLKNYKNFSKKVSIRLDDLGLDLDKILE